MCKPVEFNSNQFCWVEICWITDGPGDDYWQALRPAQSVLGLNITEANYNAVAEPRRAPQILDTTPSIPMSPSSHESTPPSIIQVLQPSPQHITLAVAALAQLMETLQIQDPSQMSTTVTIQLDFTHYTDTMGLLYFLFSYLPLIEAHVRYDLLIYMLYDTISHLSCLSLCMILSRVCVIVQ